MMAELFLIGLMGLFLGTVFFGGLWWTVQKLVSPLQNGKQTIFWFFGVWLLRMSLALTGFYIVAVFFSAGHWERLGAYFFGFMLARPLVSRLTRSEVNNAS